MPDTGATPRKVDEEPDEKAVKKALEGLSKPEKEFVEALGKLIETFPKYREEIAEGLDVRVTKLQLRRRPIPNETCMHICYTKTGRPYCC